MIKHIPYTLATIAIIVAIYFAIVGLTFNAGILMLISGAIYMFLSDSVLVTTSLVEEKVPQLSFVSRLIGGKSPRGMKLGGIVLIIVGVVWVFFV